MRGAALLFLAVSATSPAWAQPPIPESPKTYVLDEPGVVDDSIERALANLFVEHDRLTSEQIVFAVFRRLQGQDLTTRTNQIFEAWRIGKRGKDNGLLLALFWEDRQVRIEVGYGLEGLLTDARAKRVIEETLVPELRAGSPERALSLSALDILTVLESPLAQNGRAEQILRSGGLADTWVPRESGNPGGSWLVWVFLGLVLFSIAWNFLSSADAHFTGGGWYRPNPWRRARRSSIFWSGVGGWGSGGGGWGGGGGGGFLGGGGRSGGGGASGSW